MKTVEKSAKTVDAAIELALAELNAGLDQVEYEILENGSKGILGLGAKDARVRVTLQEGPEQRAMEFLTPIFKKLHVNPTHIAIEREGALWISFSGQSLGAIIGRRGETLDALQYLTNLAVNRQHDEKTRIILDVEGYRNTREETLAALAKKMADKARKSGRDVVLEPMSPHERRIIHMTLQEERGIRTYSQGEEPYRQVVITKKGANRDH